jgi:hypothetical protein
MSTWTWIAIGAAIILLIVLIILFSREKGKNKKSGAPAKIVFKSNPQTIKAGSMSGMITIQIQDANGKPVNAASGTVITLASSSGGIFCANSDGLLVITSITVNDKTNSATFYYKDSTKGNATITVSCFGLIPGKQTETIN